MICVIYRSAETTVCLSHVIYKHQEHFTHVGSTYPAVFRQEVVSRNDNSSLLWIVSTCITVPFEGPSSLLESTSSNGFVID